MLLHKLKGEPAKLNILHQPARRFHISQLEKQQFQEKRVFFGETRSIIILNTDIQSNGTRTPWPTLRQYDEWLGADRLRSKAIVPKTKEDGGKAAFGAVMHQAAKKFLLVKPKVQKTISSRCWHFFCPRFAEHQTKLSRSPMFPRSRTRGLRQRCQRPFGL